MIQSEFINTILGHSHSHNNTMYHITQRQEELFIKISHLFIYRFYALLNTHFRLFFDL